MDDYEFFENFVMNDITETLKNRDTDKMYNVYDPEMKLLVIGTAKNGIIGSFQELRESGIIEATVAVENIQLENIDLLQLEIINNLAILGYTYDFSYTNQGTEFSHFMRVTQVMQKTEKGWKMKQFHNSFPQFGESTNWPSLDGLNQDLLDLINKYQIDAQQLLNDERQQKIFEYLNKAKALMDQYNK